MSLIPSFLWRDSSTPTGTPGPSISQALGTTGSGGWSPSSTTWNFLKVDRWVFFTMSISGNASATGYVSVSLPYTAANATAFAAREDNVTGLVCVGEIGAGSSTMNVTRYDNGSPGGTPGGGGNSGVRIVVSGCFEATG